MFEHYDIKPEKPFAKQEAKEQRGSSLFLNLTEEALRDFDEARREKPESAESPVRNLGFFFKKSWDKFAEPVLEYDALREEIDKKEWESKGAKSRAVSKLEEARRQALQKIEVIIPNFSSLGAEEQRKMLSRAYRGFAEYLTEKKVMLERMAEGVGKGFRHSLEALGIALTHFDDRYVRERITELAAKKERSKERAKERKKAESLPPPEEGREGP